MKLQVFRIGGPSTRDKAQQAVNEAQIPFTIDRAIEDYKKATEPGPTLPVIIHHPVDPVLQPGESAKLGGAMEISSRTDQRPPDQQPQ